MHTGHTTLTPARPAHIPTPALRTSHFPDPPDNTLELHSQLRLDTEGCQIRTCGLAVCQGHLMSTSPVTPEETVDAAFMVKCLEVSGRDLLSRLANAPGRTFTLMELQEEFDQAFASSSPVRSAVEHMARANEIADSFGWPPLVEISGVDCTVSEFGAAIIPAGLQELSRWQKAQAAKRGRSGS